jgi:hypothetical protein
LQAEPAAPGPPAGMPEDFLENLAEDLDDARQRAIIARVLSLLDNGDMAAAADALVAARDQCDLSLSQAMALSDTLLSTMAFEPDLPGGAVLYAASRLGWHGKDADRAWPSPVQSRLQDRLAAEEWVAKLSRQGRAWRAWLGGHRAGAARLLLGRGWPLLSWLLPPEPHFSRFMREYSVHENWAGQRLDPRRIRLLRRMAAAPFPRIASVLWYGLMIGPFVVGVVLSGIPGLSVVVFFWGWLIRRLRRFARSIILMMVLLSLYVVLAAATGSFVLRQ